VTKDAQIATLMHPTPLQASPPPPQDINEDEDEEEDPEERLAYMSDGEERWIILDELDTPANNTCSQPPKISTKAFHARSQEPRMSAKAYRSLFRK
jgi:hypothetical protein